jgi:ComF family protein
MLRPDHLTALSRPCRRLAGAWADALVRAGRAALPQRCALCVGAARGCLVCAACAAALPRVDAACPSCALPSPDGAVCGACLARPPPWSRAIAALVYGFPVDRLLVELKYGGRLALAEWAGTTLAASVAPSLAARGPADRPDCVVALPLSDARQRERGFNQAREIARRVADEVDLPLATPLRRGGHALPQTSLAWKERVRNVRGAFAADGTAHGTRIALVDDVLTTGATLAEAARTLRQAGAADVECWVVARTLGPDTR